jgi:hypothetical protein
MRSRNDVGNYIDYEFIKKNNELPKKKKWEYIWNNKEREQTFGGKIFESLKTLPKVRVQTEDMRCRWNYKDEKKLFYQNKGHVQIFLCSISNLSLEILKKSQEVNLSWVELSWVELSWIEFSWVELSHLSWVVSLELSHLSWVVSLELSRLE